MSRACSMHGRNQKCTQNFSQILKGREYLEDLDMNGRITLIFIVGKCSGKSGLDASGSG